MRRETIFRDHFGLIRVTWVLLMALIGLLSVIFVIAFVSSNIGADYGKTYCSKYEQTWNRPTKFVRYSHWSWDCLTKTDTNQWLPTGQVRVVTH